MQDHLLIIATDAQALVASATRSHQVAPVVIDAFADCDTSVASTDHYQPDWDIERGFDAESLHACYVECMQQHPQLNTCVIGSGLEACPEFISNLAQSAQAISLCANDADTFRLCADRAAIKARAQTLGIRCIPNDASRPQLVKQSQTSGGQHIRFAEGQALKEAPGQMLEPYLPGETISHVFLAAQGRIQTVGIGKQWHAAQSFAYGGSINDATLSQEEQQELEATAQRLAKDLNLRGLNNIDYRRCSGTLYFLEINPRPSASFGLYDACYTDGLLAAHIRACRGQLTAPQQPLSPSARAIVYAVRDTSLTAIEWPDWVHNIPCAENVCAGKPICSVSAQSTDISSTLMLLQCRIRDLSERLSTRSAV